MSHLCTRCFAPLSIEEKFYFYCNCEACELDTMIVIEQSKLIIKSPLFFYRMALFYLRRLWFKLKAK